jgi:F5/8 type C domain
MKRCPTCRSIYTDDSLRFCLQDGAQLVHTSAASDSSDSEETWRGHLAERSQDEAPLTEILDARVAPTVRLPTPAPTEVVRSRATRPGPQPHDNNLAPQHVAPKPKSYGPVMTAAIVAIAALLLVSVGLGLALWLRSSNGSNRNAATGEGNRQATTNSNRDTASGNERTVSDRITATASSTRPPLAGNTYEASNALDGRLMTAWVEGVEGPGLGQWIRCDFEREVTLKRISIAPGYFKSPQIWARNNRIAAATFYFSDGTSRQFRFADRMAEQLLELGAVRTSWVRVVIDEVYAGTDPDTAVSQLAFESEP